jgi:inorganic phosphate transporter, PiT family
MITVGKGIAPLDLFSAFVKILAEAMTLLLFTQIGIPVSSPQGLWGQWCGWVLLGAGTVNPKMLVKITAVWVMTPFASGFMTILFVYVTSIIM